MVVVGFGGDLAFFGGLCGGGVGRMGVGGGKDGLLLMMWVLLWLVVLLLVLLHQHWCVGWGMGVVHGCCIMGEMGEVVEKVVMIIVVIGWDRI